MNHSQSCIDLIKRYEDEAGFLAGRCSRLKAYRCPAGIWTIGWGHTAGVHEGMEITAQEAEGLLWEDVLVVRRDLAAILRVTVTEGQREALVSLGFNLAGGPRALPRIAPKLWAALNAGDVAAAAREFLDIDRDVTGKVLAGLSARRRAEANLFIS